MFCLVSYEHLIKASFLRKTLNYIKTLKIKIMHRWRSHQIAQRNHSLQNPSAVISCNGLSANHKTVSTGPVSAGANGKPVSAGRANGRAVLSGVGNYNIMPFLHACQSRKVAIGNTDPSAWRSWVLSCDRPASCAWQAWNKGIIL